MQRITMISLFKRLFMSEDKKAEIVFGFEEDVWYLRKDLEALEKRVEKLESKKEGKK